MSQSYGSTQTSSASNENEIKGEIQEISDFRRALPQFCVVGVKNLILLGWGLILGYPTVLIPGLQYNKNGNSTTDGNTGDFILNAEEISWIGSINLLCVPLGSLTSGILMDPIGKRRLMQILNIPMLAAWALFYFATDISQIYIGLCLSGMSGGLLEAPLLIYIAEAVQPQFRGMLTASGTATVIGGVCLQFIIGTVVHWRTVAMVSAIIPFLAFNSVFLVPESPYWLYKKNRPEDARKSLQWLRGWVPFENVKSEFEQITYSVEDLIAEKKARALKVQQFSNRVTPFTKRSFIAPFLLIIFGFISGHFSGMTPLQTYAIQILGSYNVPIDEYYATILLGAAQVLGCLTGMVFVRSMGKRRLVFISMIGCGLCFFAVATRSHMKNDQLTPKPSTHSTLTTELQSSFENLEKNVLNAMTAFREKLNDEAVSKYGTKLFDISDENANRLAQILEITKHFMDSNAFEYLSPDVFLGMLASEKNSTDDDPGILTKYLFGMINDPNLFKNVTADKIINETKTNLENFKNFDPKEILDLLNISRAIVQSTIPNELDEETILLLIEKIDEEVEDIILTNTDNFDELGIADDLNDLSEILASLTKNLTASPAPIDEPQHIEENHSWTPLVLLLGGSLFAHMGAKLFPWMLIGEVYPMEIRNAAAGISSAVGYLIGFLSNKLFLNMVAIFTLNGTFWFYSAVATIGCIVLYFILPETESKTLQEIEILFDKNKRNNIEMSESSRNDTASNDTDATRIDA